jgi:hypothetical protein
MHDSCPTFFREKPSGYPKWSPNTQGGQLTRKSQEKEGKVYATWETANLIDHWNCGRPES